MSRLWQGQGRQARYWRTSLALDIERVHRAFKQRGLEFTDEDWHRLERQIWDSDRLSLRAHWLRYGGKLEVRAGRLELSKTLTEKKRTAA